MSLVGLEQSSDEAGGLSTVELGSRNKYRRLVSELPDETHKDQKERVQRTRRYVLACAFFASLNSLLLGYDVGVMSGAIIFIQEDLKISGVQEEVLVGCLSIVSLFGSLAGGRASDAIGRKWTMALAAIIFQTGALLMTLAPSFHILIWGRLLAGVGIGFGVMIAPVYIAEISPAVSRGSLTSFPEIFINLGILLGYVSNLSFSGLPAHISWRIMLGVGVIPSIFIAIALFVIPESPRWLVMENRVGEARSVLLKTIASDAEVEERLAEIQQAANSNEYKKSVWRELLRPSGAVSRMLVVGIGIQCFQQITGIDALVYYSPEIFKAAGIEDKDEVLGATVAVGLMKTGFILIAIALIDRVGRKPLLYVSTVGMTVCLFTLGVGLSGVGSGWTALSVVSVCGDVAFFSIGMGPVCWVLTSEIFPLRLRAQAVALGAMGNRLCSGLVAISFLSLASAITVAGAFFAFSGVSVLAVVFVYLVVPETKGRSLEEIELMFGDKVGEGEGGVELGDGKCLVQNGQSILVDGEPI